MTAAEFQVNLKKCDREVTEMEKAAESKCHQFYDGKIDFLGEMGL